MDAVYAAERRERAEKERDTNPHADAAVDDIVNRWKVRYHLSRLSAPVATSIAAPDLRGSLLRQRAELLREVKPMSVAPTAEDELVETMDELASTRQQVASYQAKLEQCEAALRTERGDSAAKTAEIERLRQVLAAQQKDIEALRADLKAATDAAASCKGGRASRSTSFKHQRTASTTEPALPPADNSPMPAPPTPNRYSTAAAGHTPPARRTASREATPLRSTRSPARVPPPAAARSPVPDTARTPMRRRGFI